MFEKYLNSRIVTWFKNKMGYSDFDIEMITYLSLFALACWLVYFLISIF